MNRPMSRRGDRHGFTLLELMVTITVIGILTTITVPRLAGVLRRGQEGSTRGNLGSIRSALGIYYAETEGLYPDDALVLAAGGRFLKSFPKALIPPHHTASNSVSLGAGTVGINDVGGWAYSNLSSDSEFGHLWVNCTHTDSKGTAWSSF